jgi:hypothetical protein
VASKKFFGKNIPKCLEFGINVLTLQSVNTDKVKKLFGMAELLLKKSVLDRIKETPLAFGEIAHTLRVAPRTLTDLLLKNDPRFTQASVLNIIKKHLKEFKNDSELLEEVETA